jgi:hypothetical protein
MGSNPCQNALFAIHLELYAVLNEATQENTCLLTDEGYNASRARKNAQKLAKNG